MDNNTAIVIVAAIVALIAIAGYLRFKQSGNTKITLPFGTTIEQQGSNRKDGGGIKGKGLKSSDGGLDANDTTGGGIEVEKVDVKKDIKLNSSDSQQQPPK